MSVSPPARALLRFAAAPLPLQPGSQVRPLLRLQVYAIADELQRLLQRALRGRNGVLREEVLHLLFVCGIAEISRAIHHRPGGEVGELGRDLRPVLADEVPGLVASIRIIHQPANYVGRVLGAHLR